MTQILTLCVVTRPGQILLGYKKRGFGSGRWNGFGGHVEAKETITDAALRELREESDLIAHALDHRGVIEFSFDNGTDDLVVHIFSVDQFSGEPIETDEMRPVWFAIDQIPFGEMWADDQHWLPLFLAGKRFIGEFHFKDHDTIIKHRLKEV